MGKDVPESVDTGQRVHSGNRRPRFKTIGVGSCAAHYPLFGNDHHGIDVGKIVSMTWEGGRRSDKHRGQFLATSGPDERSLNREFLPHLGLGLSRFDAFEILILQFCIVPIARIKFDDA